MKSDDFITADPQVLVGTPVFKGTCVPVKTLSDYLGENYTLEEFLACFPFITREMACEVWSDPKPPYPSGREARLIGRMSTRTNAYVTSH